MPVRVLFVCLGNICRSPMAEGVFQHLVDEAGLAEEITIDSAGTSGYHVGEPAHRGTRGVLSKHGIAYGGRARQITLNDFSGFDYILAMDHSNLHTLRGALPEDSTAQLRLFMSFAPGTNVQEVPDPYYSGRFDEVYELVRQGAEGLLAHIRQAHDL